MDAPGLTSHEAARSLAEFGPNELPSSVPPPLALQLVRHLAEPVMILLLIVVAVTALVLHEYPEAIAIVAIILLDSAIGLREERRANSALRSLERMRTPTCLVRRDGVPLEIPAGECVPGDVILLAAGDRIPADAKILDANDAEADESILTGESLPVAKGAANKGASSEMVLSGSLLVRGTVTARVTATGTASALGGIASQLERAEPPTPLQRELAGLSARLGLAAIVIAGGVFVLTYVVRDEGLELAFLSAVALAVAAVPQGLPAVVTIGLALGARRMAEEGAVLRRLSAVEALGSTTVILTDKTGTLTEGTLRFAGFLGAEATGPPKPLIELPREDAAWIEEIAVLCNDASDVGGDPLDVALLASVEQRAIGALHADHPRVDELPFSSERGRMSVVCSGFGGNEVVLTKGSPESVMQISTSFHRAGAVVAMDDAARDRIMMAATQLAEEGMRVLAMARRPLADHLGTNDLDQIANQVERDTTLVGFVVFRDRSRVEAAAAIAEARSAGISVRMVTGDHPGTALAVAREVGLLEAREGEGGGAVRTGAQLREEGIPEDPERYAVYARVDPSQKLALVERLQERGSTVAVTGDGVNDAPALRHADIGVAMGAGGSDVAREAADLVITDDNLATIVTAVREGRGIYEGIRKVVDYLVAGNLSEITVVLASLLLFPELGVPLLPLQLLWINLITDGLPALALGADPPPPGLMRQPPRARNVHLLSGGRFRMLLARGLLMGFAAVGTLVVSRYVLDASWEQARTVMFTSLVTTHILYSFLARRPSTGLWTNWRLIAGVALSLGGQIVIVSFPVFHDLFDVTTMPPRSWLLIAAAAAVSLSIIAATQRRIRSATS